MEPSASTPSQSKRRCFPRRKVLTNKELEHVLNDGRSRSMINYHFLPNIRNVDPPTGMAVLGSPMSHTVNVS